MILDPTCVANLLALGRMDDWDVDDYGFTCSWGPDLVLGKTCIAHSMHVDNELVLAFDDGTVAHMFHPQSCCERVSIEEMSGDLDDLLDTPLEVFEERSQRGDDPEKSATWTFYTLRTIRGSVDIRWYGTSNGNYSERAQVSVLSPASPLSAHQKLTLRQSADALRAAQRQPN